jgi:hypothetical protein
VLTPLPERVVPLRAPVSPPHKRWRSALLLAVGIAALTARAARAEQPPAPCHANPNAASDEAALRSRGDIVHLPAPLTNALARLANRPHSYPPIQTFAEADSPSQLFQYYLLTTHGFEPNVFTALIPGVNDKAMLTATGGNCGLPTVGAVRLVVEPKPGLPTDPNNVRAFIDVFTDISGLFVINNESGWYEGWMIHDLVIPPIAPARPDGHAQFGTITAADAAILAAMGSHHNVPGQIFTTDGNAVRFPADTDHFPDVQTNIVMLQLSMGAYNGMQQMDVHSYWEFNYTTNWIHPLYELPFTHGGFGGTHFTPENPTGDNPIDQTCPSTTPGSGPEGRANTPSIYGDRPGLPRDPDKFDADVDSQREFRQRFIPSGLANEVLLDVYARPASFNAGVNENLVERLFDAYAAEVARVDTNNDGVISAAEGDVDTASDGFPDNTRLFLPATAFHRFAVTREINDGLLAPRFAPSQRAWILKGGLVSVSPAVPASEGRDGDDR